MLKTLLKKQMAEIFRNYFYDPKKNKMRSRGATAMYIALYALLMVGLLGGMFALLAVGICAPMAAAGVGWLYYLVMGLIAVLLGAFGSVFSTYSSLYLSKDNDLLLSMPIPVRYVMASRLLGVYLLGLMYSGVATVPAVIVYWIVAPVTAGTVVGGVLTVLLVSVIVMVLSCLLGWVVARISLKLKNKSFITVILSLAFLAAYYFVYYKAQGLITLLAENAAVYGAKIRGSAYLLYLFGSVGAGDWLAMGLVTLSQAVLRAKLDTQLLLTGVPMLFCALCAVIVLPGGAAEMALAVVVALLYTLLSALAALALGLRLPNLTWTNEITPIKQGGSVMLALFANWLYAIALGGLYFLCSRYLSAAAYLALAAAITAAVCALLLRWVKQRGTRIFAAL